MKKTFYEKYALLLLVMIAFTVPIVGMGVKRTLENVRNNIKEWLPEGTPESVLHTWFQGNFPNEQFILMSWEGCTLNDPRMEVMRVRLLPRKNEDGNVIDEDFNLRFYESYITGPELAEQVSEGTSMTRDEAINRLKGTLIGVDGKLTSVMIYLRPGCEGENMRGAIGEIYRLARQDFVFDRRKLSPQQLAAVEEIQKEQLSHEFVKEPKNFLERKLTMKIPEKLTEDEKNVRSIPPEDLIVLHGLQPSDLHLGGPPVDNVAIDVEGNRTLMRLAWMAAVIGFTIASLCLRSVRLVLIVFCAALFATGYALAIVNFTGASTDAIMLSMPPLVYVLTMSGAIHFINYYHDALEEEGGVHGAVERAVQHAFAPVCVSAITTMLGLFSLLTSNLVPIRNFGFYSGVGVGISIFVLFLFVTSALQLFPSHRFADKMAKLGAAGKEMKRKDVIGAHWQKLGKILIYHPYVSLTLCTLILLTGFAGLPQLIPSVKLMNFFKKDTTIIHDYAWLEDHLGPLVPMEVVIRLDNEKVPQNMRDRMLLVEDAVNAVKKELVDPDVGTEASRAARPRRKLFFNKRKTTVTDEKQVGGVLSAVMLLPDPNVGSLMERSGWNGQVIRSYNKIGEFVKQDLLAAERKYEERARAAGQENLSPTLQEIGVPEPILEKLNPLNITTLQELREKTEELEAREQKIPLDEEEQTTLEKAVYSWQVDHGDELFRITCRVKALTDVDYGDFVNELRKTIDPVVNRWLAENDLATLGEKAPVETIYTGSVPIVYKTQHELMRSLYKSIIYSFLTISFVMMILLKNFTGGLCAMIPNIFPVAVVFGAMGWLGVLCDLGAMMTASVALGIATDDTIHYLTWYRRALDEGLVHKDAALSAYRRCATAMTQTTLVSAFGLSVFAFSTFTPTLYFGVMMLMLLSAALFGDLVYLPSILTVSGGKMFAKGKKVEK